MSKPKRKTWRCFHCDHVFRTAKSAREHFGATPYADASCQVNAEHLRDIEKELAKYRDEDTDLHRQIANLQGERQTVLRRAEEAGYARGLRDATP
jgi:cell division protein FtsB